MSFHLRGNHNLRPGYLYSSLVYLKGGGKTVSIDKDTLRLGGELRPVWIDYDDYIDVLKGL